MYSASTRSHSFEEEDDELASLLAMEAGFSGYAHLNSQICRCASVYQGASNRRPSSSSLNHSLPSSKKQSSSSSLDHSLSSFRPARFFCPRYEDRRPVYFLEFCFLCMKQLSHGEDLFMYRDSAYCSEECRERQTEIDEAKERKLYKFSLRKKEQRKSTKNISIRPDRVAAA